jgi:uncharacterized integral membrane protein
MTDKIPFVKTYYNIQADIFHKLEIAGNLLFLSMDRGILNRLLRRIYPNICFMLLIRIFALENVDSVKFFLRIADTWKSGIGI